jgi:hypothetical protein
VSQPAQLRGEPAAAAVILRGGPGAAYAVLAVSVLAAVLVPLGLWRPAVVLPLLVLAAVAVWWLTRMVPYQGGPPVPVWSAAACLAIAVGFGIWAGITHGEHIVLRRDAGSYALFAHWLATRHGLPVTANLSAFGGPAALAVPGFSFDSPAFYQVLTGSGSSAGAQVVPQFLLGAPALYSLGWWAAGWTGLFLVPAIVGGASILAVGGLAARLVGPRWAPLAAGALALTQPVLHAARATFSEPVALLLVLAAGSLVADAVGHHPPDVVRRLALAAGGTLGLAGLVRIDAIREVALVIPLCALLRLRRHPAALPLAGSALATCVLSAVPAVLFSRPYLNTVSASLRPLVIGTVGLTVLSALVVAAEPWWRGRRATRPTPSGDPAAVDPPSGDPAADRTTGWLAAAAGGLVLLAGIGLASRPLWTVTRQSPDDPGNALVASLQAQQGLPVDGSRTYAERSVEWLVWYTGPVVAVTALLTAAGMAALAVRWWRAGRLGASPPPPNWLVPAWVALGSVLLTLYRPGITPDHPWADRRLVPLVLPATVLAATGAAAWGVRYARRRMPAWVLVLSAVVVVLAMLVPAGSATWPLARRSTETGEPDAVTQVCAALAPGDVVVAVGDSGGGVRAQNEWVQVVRGVCGRPAAALHGTAAQQASALPGLGALVRGAGGRLVLLSAGEDDAAVSGALTGFGLHPTRAVLRHTYEDQHLLVRRPFDLAGLVIDVWLARWPAS